MDYRDFKRIDGKIVHDPDGKYKNENKGFEKSEPKNWTKEEKNALWDAVVASKHGSFEEVNKIFESKGYSGLRLVHLSFVKRYISYDAREEWLANKSLSDIVEKGEK
tara:strand:- start:502 stop:822 length:321 start_codon:yes stop_codon:yes gene_type:complete